MANASKNRTRPATAPAAAAPATAPATAPAAAPAPKLVLVNRRSKVQGPPRQPRQGSGLWHCLQLLLQGTHTVQTACQAMAAAGCTDRWALQHGFVEGCGIVAKLGYNVATNPHTGALSATPAMAAAPAVAAAANS